MEPIRRKQLIEATMASVAENGMKATTINTISNKAGMSSGIISHYFGGKQGLIEATVRHILNQLKENLLSNIKPGITPEQRLMKIVDTNFAPVQQSDLTTKTWLSFWAQSMHDPELARLQRVNNQRLISNLAVSYRALLPPSDVKTAANMTAAMIDGFWLRCALSNDTESFVQAKHLCKQYIQGLLNSKI